MARTNFTSSAVTAFVVIVKLVEASGTPGAGQERTSLFENKVLETSLLGERAEPRRLDESVCTIAASAKPISVEIGEYTLQAKFKCGGSPDATQFLPNFAEENPGSKCCTNKDCSTNDKIADYLAISGGSIKAETESNAYTVKLDEMPSERSKTMYYACKDTGATNTCTVSVVLPKAVPSNQCTLSKTVNLAVKNASDSVQFICTGSGSSLSPQDEMKVYQYTGDACGGDEQDLATLLPGSDFVRKSDGTSTLTVSKLPAKDTRLCYVCSYQDPDNSSDKKWKPCTVVVSVAGAEASSSTSTSQPTSASTGAASTSAGLAALATALLITPAAY